MQPTRPRSQLPAVLFAAVVLVGLVGGRSAASAAEFRLASLAPQDSAWGKLIQALAGEVQKATGGAVQFKLFLGGKLGDESKVMKKLGHGLDGAFFTGQGVGLILPAFRVQELPFLAESYDEADKIRKELWPLLTDAFEKDGRFVLVGPGETGLVYLFSKQPIATVEELKKSRLWVWEGDNVASDTFKVFGVSPRPLDILTVVQQLKSGGIDTVYNSPAGAVALGWTGDLAYISGRPFAYASGAFVMTKAAWERIPETQRAAVRDIVMKSGEAIIQQARKDNDAALARLVAAGGGLQKIVIPDERYQEFKKVAIAAWPSLSKNLGAEAFLTKARSTLGK